MKHSLEFGSSNGSAGEKNTEIRGKRINELLSQPSVYEFKKQPFVDFQPRKLEFSTNENGFEFKTVS